MVLRPIFFAKDRLKLLLLRPNLLDEPIKWQRHVKGLERAKEVASHHYANATGWPACFEANTKHPNT